MAPKKTVTIAELETYPNTTKFNTEEHKRLVITVRVLIKSCVRTWNKPQPTFYMELRDSSGDITAISKTSSGTDKLFHQLEENKVYTITAFRLKSSIRGYTSISHPKCIFLYNFSVVELYGSDPAPPVQWPITDLKDIDGVKFVNVIGECKSIGDVRVIGKWNKKMRTVEIQDKTDRVQLSVWEEETQKFDNLPLGSVIFVKDARYRWEHNNLTMTRFVQVRKNL